MINITDVSIEMISPKEGLIGFASLVIDGSLFLSSIAIHKKLNTEGYRITYPKKGKWDLFYPINSKIGVAIEQAILKKLKDVIKKVNNDRYNSNNDTNG